MPKTHPRVDAYGFVDELTSALGLARCQEKDTWLAQSIGEIQDQLVILMGELATDLADRDRYVADGFKRVDATFVSPLDDLVQSLESRQLSFKGWAKPGDHPVSASLDMARCICRRAERQVCALVDAALEENREVQRYLNRLSDVLWLLARWVESGRPEAPASDAE